MSLATRCPACRTTFKVVRDQLRLADGWVRCGRCQEVFQAEDALTQWQAPSPPLELAEQPALKESPARQPEPSTSASAGQPQAASPAFAAPPAAHEPARPAIPDAPVAQPPPIDTTPAPAAGSAADDGPLESPLAAPSGAPLQEPLQEPLQGPPALPEPVPEPPAGRRYVWESARQERAPNPWATAAWALTALAGLAGLLIQSAVAWHDELAQTAPALRPVLEVACVMVDCKIEPIRRIEALSVESSQLTQLGGTIYQFSATLRNRAAVELLAPALDLVLTGSDGQVIARRVLRWTDFGLRSRSMPAQQELSLQTNLNTGSNSVAGFTIELFYP